MHLSHYLNIYREFTKNIFQFAPTEKAGPRRLNNDEEPSNWKISKGKLVHIPLFTIDFALLIHTRLTKFWQQKSILRDAATYDTQAASMETWDVCTSKLKKKFQECLAIAWPNWKNIILEQMYINKSSKSKFVHA